MIDKEKQQKPKIKFLQEDNIGNPDALYDAKYLRTCFLEASAYRELLSKESIKSLIIGRTGTGKTAFIQKIILSSQDKNYQYIEIKVGDEFLGYLNELDWLKEIAEHKNIILLPFFKNLWKHIIIVNMIKAIFPSEEKFMEKILSQISRGVKKQTNAKNQLKKYVESYGEGFWNNNDHIKKLLKILPKK